MTTTINIIKGRDKVFNEFSFCISENIKNIIYKETGSPLCIENRIDKNFKLGGCSFWFEIHKFNDDSTSHDLFLSKSFPEGASINVIYNDKLDMKISSEKTKTTKVNHHTEEEISYIIVVFPTEQLSFFQDFTKVCIKYYQEFYIKYSKNLDQLDIFVNISEYWQPPVCRAKRDINTIYLPTSKKEDIVKDISNFIKPETKKKYMRFGVTYKRVYLFEGIPGSGKTSLIVALASKYGYGISIINYDKDMDDKAFRTIIKDLPEKTFLVLEDMDVMFEPRKQNDEFKNSLSLSGILNALDGISTNENFICFITTNRIKTFDKALIRPGRIDYIMSFEYMKKDQIFEIFKMFTNEHTWKENEQEKNCDIFYKSLLELNIKINVSLLQQYLFKYTDSPEDILKNIDEIKLMYESSNTQKDTDETGLYQ